MAEWDPTPQDTGDVLKALVKRVGRVEQRVAGPRSQAVITNFPNGITVSGTEINSGTPPAPLPGISLTTGLADGSAFIDVEWFMPAAGVSIISSYFIEVSTAGGIPTQHYAIGSPTRITGLLPGTTYGVRVRAVTTLGVMGPPEPSVGYTPITTPVDDTIPEAPLNPQIFRGATTVVVMWEEVPDVDVARGAGQYEVQIDTSSVFNNPDSQYREAFTSGTIISFTDLVEEFPNWYARVRAIDATGNTSTWSALAGPVTAGGVIDDMVVAGLNAAKITFGEMSGDRIQTNSLDASTIKTSALTAGGISISSGGSIIMNQPPSWGSGTGMILDSAGVRGYNSGDLRVNISALSGNATFNNLSAVGIIRTGVTGQRIVLGASGLPNTLQFYSGHVSEALPGIITCDTFTGGGLYGTMSRLRIRAPYFTGHNWPEIDLENGTHGAAIDQNSITLRSKTVYFDTEFISGRNRTLILGGGPHGTVLEAGASPIGAVVRGTATHSLALNSSGGHINGDQWWMYNLPPVTAGTFHAVMLDPSSWRLVRWTSSQRYKEDIKPVEATLDPRLIYQIQPRSFISTAEYDKGQQRVGLIAEEVAKVSSMLAGYDEEGKASTIDWNTLNTLVLAELQRLRQIIEPEA